MTDTFAALFGNAWRESETDGMGGSEPHEPVKSEIRAIGPVIDTRFATLEEAQAGGLIAYATWAELDAHDTTGLDDGAAAKVYDDAGTHVDPVLGGAPVANEGVYSFNAGSPSGFQRIANLEAEDAQAWAALSQAWAEGTEPGGSGTQSAREWAEDAAGYAGSIDGLFDTIPTKNLYDPDLAEDGQIRNFSTGIKTASANSILSGKAPVTEGVRYTWSQRSPRTGFYPHVFAWNGSTYLGALSSIAGSDVQFLQPTEAGGASNGHLQITGTVPVGSGITHLETLLLYPYAAHDVPTFDLIRNGVQLEVGSAVTSFEAFDAPPRLQLKTDALPEEVDLAAEAFTVRPGKNLYDKSLAVDQSLYSFTTGNAQANTSAMRSGKIPVVPGQVLTASVPDTVNGFLANPHAWNADNQYQGMGALQSTNAVVPGFNLVQRRGNGTGHREVTFTVPAGIYFVGFSLMYPYQPGHSTDDFNAVRDVFQLELGEVATAYEPFGAGDMAILNEAATEPVPVYSQAPAEDEVVVQIVGDLAYVRGRLGGSPSYDVVHLLTRRAERPTTGNQRLNFDGARSIRRDVVANATALAFASPIATLANQGDDTTPVKYNGDYMGGNGHGVSEMRILGIPAGHNKTVEDEGSEYENGSGVSFYIVRVFDAFTLWVLSENVGASEALWEFNPTIGGSTLTHVAGGTNTGAINFSTNVSANWTPSTFNRTLSIRIDGAVIPWADGAYVGRRVEIDEVSEITNPVDALAYMVANVGSAVPLWPDAATIDAQVRTAITYRFAENGSVSVYHPLQVKQELTLDIFGAVQASRITVPAGGSPQQFIPNTSGWTPGTDFEAGVNVSGSSVPTYDVTVDKWDDPYDPPCFMAQRALDGSAVPHWHFILGISPLSGVGAPELRKDLAGTAAFNGATGKMYVEAMSAGGAALPVPIPAGAYYETTGFRIFGHADSTPSPAAVFGWYYDGDDVGVVAHFPAAVTSAILPVPARFIGCQAELVSGPHAELKSGRVTPDGLVVTMTDPGGVVIRIVGAADL